VVELNLIPTRRISLTEKRPMPTSNLFCSISNDVFLPETSQGLSGLTQLPMPVLNLPIKNMIYVRCDALPDLFMLLGNSIRMDVDLSFLISCKRFEFNPVPCLICCSNNIDVSL
jgi:hypothetical protein